MLFNCKRLAGPSTPFQLSEEKQKKLFMHSKCTPEDDQCWHAGVSIKIEVANRCK